MLMTLPILDEKCTACDGNGYVPNDEWVTWGAAFNAAGIQNVQHDEGCYKADYSNAATCPRCKAERDFLDEHPEPVAREELPCSKCEGSKYEVTAAGRELLAFLWRHR